MIDSASPDMHEQIEAVKNVLSEIDNDVPVLNVFNKIDLTGEPAQIGYAEAGKPNRVYVSAKANLGMAELSLAVQQLLTGTLTVFDLTLPFGAGQLKNALYELGVIEAESYDDSGHERLTIRLQSDKLKQLLGQAGIDPLDVLPLAQATLLMPKLEPFEQQIQEDHELLSATNTTADDAPLPLDELTDQSSQNSDH